MGALADRCPQCGVFLRKGARRCKRCSWEPELFLPPAEEKRAFRRGLLVGLLAGAGSTVVLGLLLGLVLR